MARSETAIRVLLLEEHIASHLHFLVREEGLHCERALTRACSDAGELREIAAETGLPDGEFATVIPRHQATLRLLTLPSRDSAEIASMVALASEEWAPYPREQLELRHHILEALPSGESRVLVVLVHKEIVNQQIERLREAGLVPGQILFSTACLHAVAHASPMAPSGRYALACVSSDALEVLVIRDGVLEFSRGVAHHTDLALNTDEGRNALGYEMRDALAAYRRDSEDDEDLNVLYVTGTVLDEETLRALPSAVGRPCCPADFLEGAFSSPIEGAEVPVVAVGAALVASGRANAHFDFLPTSLSRQRALRDFAYGLRRVGVLAALLPLLLLVAFGQAVYQRMALIKDLRTQAEVLAPTNRDTLTGQPGLEAIARQVDRRGDFLALLAGVAQAAPTEGLNITRVEFERESGMNVWGRARSKDLVLGNFLGELRKLGEGSLAQLARAHSQYETPAQERGQNVIDYQIAIPAFSEEPSHGVPAPTR